MVAGAPTALGCDMRECSSGYYFVCSCATICSSQVADTAENPSSRGPPEGCFDTERSQCAGGLRTSDVKFPGFPKMRVDFVNNIVRVTPE
ncbi:unnamed protein product [Cylicostephanus goldi]|uniref:Uncharacterized protein n=1 Tax=Cylicostephanus goldi TaxID=71465 RepID=A0A3P7NGF8_CYLGO|nr:unnamed protein product [Cylicostephanus goldi]